MLDPPLHLHRLKLVVSHIPHHPTPSFHKRGFGVIQPDNTTQHNTRLSCLESTSLSASCCSPAVDWAQVTNSPGATLSQHLFRWHRATFQTCPVLSFVFVLVWDTSEPGVLPPLYTSDWSFDFPPCRVIALYSPPHSYHIVLTLVKSQNIYVIAFCGLF